MNQLSGPIYVNRLTGAVYLQTSRAYGVSDWAHVLCSDPCPYCCAVPSGRIAWPSSTMNLEHVQPRSEGGTNAWSNVVGAHTGCNSDRQSMPLLRFLLYRRAVAGRRRKKERAVIRKRFA